MYEKFSTLEELYLEMDRDKYIADAGIVSANRYPLRFILFENFCDFYEFVDKCAEKGIQVVGIEKWLDLSYADVFQTYSFLSKKICEYINKSKGQDAVITPFSELARFYSKEEFRALVTTIRAKEANAISQEKHLRIYVPLIGMQGKLDSFRNDNEIRIWEYVSPIEEKHYRLILNRGSNYQVSTDESLYSYCYTVHDWITLWKLGKNVHSNIICCSIPIFDNSFHARPDNAFDYTICNNAFEFLRDGLGIIPLNIKFRYEELPHWEKLAAEIKNIQNFKFENFVLYRFNVQTLEEEEFMHFWFKTKDPFSRWLLKTYYLMKFCEGKYLCRVLSQCETTHTSELFDKLALLIFGEDCNTFEIEERKVLLSSGVKYNGNLTEQSEIKLKQHLIELSERPGSGYVEAMKYMTSLTTSEKQLIITWYGQGKISRDSVEKLLPDLYAYTAPLPQGVFGCLPWLEEYFNEYRFSKLANKPTSNLLHILKTNNNCPASFENWRNEFKTVKTILSHREDIEVYYWVDGLGVDWIPLIIKILEEHHGDGVYLNEVYLATAQLPTTTSVNKVELEALSHAQLRKIGDLDAFAHKNKKYPDYIHEELHLIRQAIKEALNQYNGKKIAFISDHGISYMPQHGMALDLAGVKGEHSGRCGTWKKTPIPQDKKYVIANAENMICSLSYDSLTNKTPNGQGAHGGATPEELLVPIVIVSGQRNQSNYSASLMEKTVSSNEPVVKYEIKGVLSVDVPKVEYNGMSYSLLKVKDNEYISAELNLVESSNRVTLVIGDFSQTDTIIVKTGVDEEDIFGDI